MSTAPSASGRRLHHRVNLVRLRHVGAVIGDLDAELLGQARAQRLDLCRVAEAVEHDVGALRRQAPGRCQDRYHWSNQ
jgi:hypothetical protein